MVELPTPESGWWWWWWWRGRRRRRRSRGRGRRRSWRRRRGRSNLKLIQWQSSCIFLKNKPSIINWYILGVWLPIFYKSSTFYARGKDGCDWGSNLALTGMTVQCYTPTPQCPLCSQQFCVQFLSILTWSWSWRWTPRRECLDPNCVRSDGCMLYKCGYRLPASPPVKIFQVYVLKYRVWTNT